MRNPRVSVVVRSFRRPDELFSLLGRLDAQDLDEDFEIVVVEQSEDPALLQRLRDHASVRVRVIPTAPLGAPGARNEGVRRARGEILVFIDDDDLPVGRDWLRTHVANYDKGNCVGVSGRLSPRDAVPAAPRWPRLVRWLAMRHTFLRDPRTFAFGSLRKRGIDFLIGSNFSVRRSLVERLGGWDEGVLMGEEQSFAFRFARQRRPGEYFVYDPDVVIWRRVNVAGGLDRRSGSNWFVKDLTGRVAYYHGVVAHYFPWRFRLLYPLYVLRTLQQVLLWIWDADNASRGFRGRLWASLVTLALAPSVELGWGWDLGLDKIRRVSPVAPFATAFEDASQRRDVAV